MILPSMVRIHQVVIFFYFIEWSIRIERSNYQRCFFHNKCVFICRCCFPRFFSYLLVVMNAVLKSVHVSKILLRQISICRKGYFLFKLRSWRNYGCNNSFNRLKKYFNVKFLLNNKYISCKLDNLYYISIICRNSTENRQKMQHWVFTI